MRSLNRVMLMGHLAADPELRQTKSGIGVANFPIAINRSVKGDDGKKAETCDFHRIIAWNGLSTVCGRYLAKGMPVLVEGRLINRSFDDKEGNRHYRTEVVADRVDFFTLRKAKKGEQEAGFEPLSQEESDETVEIEEREAVAA